MRAIDESFPPGIALHGRRHNRTVLNSETEEEVEPCVCSQFDCPLDGDCGKKNVVYQAEVTTEDRRIEFYIGSTSQTFKG